MQEGQPRTHSSLGIVLIALGAACLLAVILTHVAERFHIFPAMGWGRPDSVGHYLDLVSAVFGSILIPLGFAIMILPLVCRRP
jgi:hypothetical protein